MSTPHYDFKLDLLKAWKKLCEAEKYEGSFTLIVHLTSRDGKHFLSGPSLTVGTVLHPWIDNEKENSPAEASNLPQEPQV